MDVSFRSSKLHRECEDFRLSTRKWGPENAEAIVKRITDILAFQTLAKGGTATHLLEIGRGSLLLIWRKAGDSFLFLIMTSGMILHW